MYSSVLVTSPNGKHQSMCSLCKAFIPNGELGLVHSPQLWGKQMLGGAEKDIQSISCLETSRAAHMGSYPLLPHNQLLPQFLGSFLKGNKCFGSHNSLLAATINPKGKIVCNGFMGGSKVARSYARNKTIVLQLWRSEHLTDPDFVIS